ncbi:MAG: tetratricopeptide repeat protein [Bacteroidetes bacterium]|nr:tetratricopeptide repeat protein [Bacteroidota bacterium]
MRILFFLLFLSTFHFAFSNPSQDGKKKKGKKGDISVLNDSTTIQLGRLLLDAEKAKVTEDWEEAIRIFNEILSLDSKNSNAHYQLSQIYASQQKLSQAEEEALAAIKLDAKNKWYLESLTAIYMDQGKTKEAAEVYKTLISKFPPNPDYYLNLGFLYSRTGQFEQAIKVYEQFEKNFGLDENVVMEKKNLFLRLNKFNEALNEVHKLVDAFPGETSYMMMEADLYRANKMRDQATEIYKKVLVLEPDNASALLALAEIGMQDGNANESISSIKKVFENPNVDVDTKIRILFPYIQFWDLKKENKQDAFDLAAILVRVHPEDAKAFAIKGDLYYLDEQNEPALEAYLRSLKLNKSVFQVWQQVMVIYNLQKDWSKLQQFCTEAMEYFPNQSIIYLFKGGAEYQLKDYALAVKSYSKGEKMSVENDKLRAQFFSNIGDAYHSLNQQEESDSAYEKSLRLDPENAYVLNNYSYYLSMRKTNLEKAKQMSAYSNKLVPGNSSFLDTYAWILFEMKDYAGAKEWQEKAMAADGEKSSTILEHFGDMLFMLGKTDEALNYWRQAKEHASESETLDRKIAERRYIE